MLLPDRGRLGVLPLPSLLLLLERERFSGTLQLRHDELHCTVSLSDGRPVRVLGTGGGLAAALEAAGRLRREDASRVAAQVARTGGSEERVLLSLGLLSPRELVLCLREHERSALLACFAWPDGGFELTPGKPLPPEAAAFAHDPGLLVHHGVSSHWDDVRTRAALGPAAGRFASPAADFSERVAGLTALPELEALRTHLDGRTTLAAAAQKAGPRGTLGLALVLDARGALAYSDAPAPSEEEAEPTGLEGPEIEIVVTGREPARKAPDAVPGPGPGTAPTGDDRIGPIRDALQEKHARLHEIDHYEILGIAQGADAATVRRAYLAAAKSFHPDAAAQLGLEDLRQIANEVFARITKAHGVLSDPVARREYDESLSGGGAVDAQRYASAEISYRKGEVLLRKGSFDEALLFLRPAVELCDDDAAYRCALGWALFKKPASEPDAARSELERAVALDAKSALAHYRLGMVLRALGKAAESAEHLARARALDPGTMLSR